VYAAGPGENAPMPPAYTGAEKHQIVKIRKAARANPFATAAGMTPVPLPRPGRAYFNLWDDDEPPKKQRRQPCS